MTAKAKEITENTGNENYVMIYDAIVELRHTTKRLEDLVFRTIGKELNPDKADKKASPTLQSVLFEAPGDILSECKEINDMINGLHITLF